MIPTIPVVLRIPFFRMRQIVEHGVPGHLKYVWEPRRPRCLESHSSAPVPVALKEFSPALFSLFMGVALAILVMLIEMYLDRRERRRRAGSMDQPLDVPQEWLQDEIEQYNTRKFRSGNLPD